MKALSTGRRATVVAFLGVFERLRRIANAESSAGRRLQSDDRALNSLSGGPRVFGKRPLVH